MQSANRLGQGLTDNYMSSGDQHFTQMAQMNANTNTLDQRKDIKVNQIQMIDRNVAHKRRSIEAKEAVMGSGSGNYEHLAHQ